MGAIKEVYKNNARFNMQEIFDNLYAESSKNYEFKNLYELIRSDDNIKLAYRNIRGNKGSKTAGTNKLNIQNIGDMEEKEVVNLIQNKLENYNPGMVRRVMIPKRNGKLRPLGIPTIEDRLIQQCFKQILEPICEAKFHNHSYGFRPNRSCEHAQARFQDLINRGYHYVVDVDIKGFFDNINHNKLKKQIWSLGIHDKKVIAIIGKMLKAPIENEGIPQKGTPQGGILSPLLSNIALNELDWWISNQYETNNIDTKWKIYKTNLKKIYIVRYADDFKILCKNYISAKKMFYGVKEWLKIRLGLEISKEKSKITNLKQNSSEFLGISCRAFYKGTARHKWVCKSRICDSSKKSIIMALRVRMKEIKEYPSGENTIKFNQLVLGAQNYYKMASNVNVDFSEMEYKVKGSLLNLKKVGTYKGARDNLYERLYGNYNTKTYYIQRAKMFLISGVRNKPPVLFTQKTCDYREEGRELVNNKIMYRGLYNEIYKMMNNSNGNIEFKNNKASKFLAQKGKCAISRLMLVKENTDCHHIIPKELGGTDEYTNLILLHKEVHKLIHMTDEEELKRRIIRYKLNVKKINKYREQAGKFKVNLEN